MYQIALEREQSIKEIRAHLGKLYMFVYGYINMGMNWKGINQRLMVRV